jgi:hypothetical protein
VVHKQNHIKKKFEKLEDKMEKICKDVGLILEKLENRSQNFDDIIGPYLQLVKDVLYPPNGEPLFETFLFNIQYYNQSNYYSTYTHIFSDITGGPYDMTNSASCQSIVNYFQTVYGNIIPTQILNSIVVGKLLVAEAGESGYVDLDTLSTWFQTATLSNINYGGYMF